MALQEAGVPLTFARLREHPELLTDTLSSPLIHADGTLTVIWEGDPGTAFPQCKTEWLPDLQPLEHIPGTRIWGTDLHAPPLPRTICSYVRVMGEGRMLPSPRHHPDVRGADLPPLLPISVEQTTLAEDVTLPAPGLAGDSRRIRIYVPPDYRSDQPYPALFWLDAQSDIDQLGWLPGLLETLYRQGEIPPLILVAMDHGGWARSEEYLADGHRNVAARTWIWDTVLPYVAVRYPLNQCWAAGSSNGASMALQLALAKPGIFAGSLCISSRHRQGLGTLLALAEAWPGGGRFFLGQGDFGLGEQQALPASHMLAERLQKRGACVHLAVMHGYGHTFDAFFRMFSDGLPWLFKQ